MRAHPDGKAVWEMARDLWPGLRPVPPTLVHIDYWPGNILWHRGRIAAVVDWEEAAYGDPGIDVAYCRMEMVLSGVGHVADEFLRAYETARGRRVENLAFWELTAAARPMFSPEGWITESPAREVFRHFIAGARRRAGY
jgi:aminoglycoside phosphotransferase (APT) family kinase protein